MHVQIPPTVSYNGKSDPRRRQKLATQRQTDDRQRQNLAAVTESRVYDFTNISRAELAELVKSGELDADALVDEVAMPLDMISHERFNYIRFLESRLYHYRAEGEATEATEFALAKVLALQGRSRQPRVDAYA